MGKTPKKDVKKAVRKTRSAYEISKAELDSLKSIKFEAKMIMPEEELVVKSVYNNPEYSVIEAEIADLENQKKIAEAKAKDNSRFDTLHRNSSSYIADLPGNNVVTYKADQHSSLKFKVTRSDDGSVKSIVMINGKDKKALSAEIDRLPGGDSRLRRGVLASKIEDVITSGNYTKEEIEERMASFAKQFEEEYERTQPARRRYTKEWNNIKEEQESFSGQADEMGKRIATLKEKQSKLPAMTEQEGKEALAELDKSQQMAYNKATIGMLR